MFQMTLHQNVYGVKIFYPVDKCVPHPYTVTPTSFHPPLLLLMPHNLHYECMHLILYRTLSK